MRDEYFDKKYDGKGEDCQADFYFHRADLNFCRGDLRQFNAQDETTRMREDFRDLLVRSWRATGVVMATIFLAVLLALNLFGLLGFGFNLLTLAGFALGFGMLVDNAIVVVENISRLRVTERGQWERGERGAGGGNRGKRNGGSGSGDFCFDADDGCGPFL